MFCCLPVRQADGDVVIKSETDPPFLLQLADRQGPFLHLSVSHSFLLNQRQGSERRVRRSRTCPSTTPTGLRSSHTNMRTKGRRTGHSIIVSASLVLPFP